MTNICVTPRLISILRTQIKTQIIYLHINFRELLSRMKISPIVKHVPMKNVLRQLFFGLLSTYNSLPLGLIQLRFSYYIQKCFKTWSYTDLDRNIYSNRSSILSKLFVISLLSFLPNFNILKQLSWDVAVEGVVFRLHNGLWAAVHLSRLR